MPGSGRIQAILGFTSARPSYPPTPLRALTIAFGFSPLYWRQIVAGRSITMITLSGLGIRSRFVPSSLSQARTKKSTPTDQFLGNTLVDWSIHTVPDVVE